MSDLSPDAKNLWERAKKGGLEPSDVQVERVRQAVMQRIAVAPNAPRAGSSVGSLPKWAKVAGLCVALGGIVATGAKLVPRSAPVPAPAPVATMAPTPTPEVPPPGEAPSMPERETLPRPNASAPVKPRA